LGCEAKGEAGPRSLGLAEAEEGVGLLAQKQRGRFFFPFSILFSKQNSIMNQMQIQIEFQIYFSIQIKVSKFW